MPKQGQFARSGHKKIIHDLRRRRPDSSRGQRTITENMVPNFILVRYELTTGKRLTPIQRETGQRFIQELMPRLMDHHYDLGKAIQETLVQINSRVPWQFFMALSQEWPDLAKFLHRELPALPLKQPVIIQHPVDQPRLTRLISDLLAKRIAGITLIHQQNSPMKAALANQLQQSFYDEKSIEWTKVGHLLAPFGFPIDEQLDEGTQQWLRKLTALPS